MRRVLLGVAVNGVFALLGCGGKERLSADDAHAGASTAGTGGSAGASDGGGGTLPYYGVCAPYCATTADCCTDCTYPNHLACQDRQCVSLGCSTDAECIRAEGPNRVCHEVQGFPSCTKPCQADADCDSPRGFCVGPDDAGDKYCGAFPGLILPCFQDSDCTGVCDPSTHLCGCSADSQCPTGSLCEPVR